MPSPFDRLDLDLPRIVVRDWSREDFTALLEGAPGRPMPEAGVLGVPVASASDDPSPQPRRDAVDAAVLYSVNVGRQAGIEGFAGAAGTVLTLSAPLGSALPPRIVLVGVGGESPAELRRAGAALARAGLKASSVAATVVAGLDPERQQAFVEGFLLAAYRGPRIGADAGEDTRPGELQLLGAHDLPAVSAAQSLARATWRARLLANTPSNVKNPAWMRAQARKAARGRGVTVKAWDARRLAAEGFNAILAVGAGSASAPTLVQLDYEPAPAEGARVAAKHIVLIGKGITFDTGGISLKDPVPMIPMKSDMAGAAAVLSVLAEAAALNLPHRVTALLPLAENAIGGGSYRPSDVVTGYGGKTIEVSNTDAEGRMVLSDAISYAVEQLRPDAIVDIATLTGAARLGLGVHHAALYGTSPAMIAGLVDAGERSGERVWHMPLVDEYRSVLDSDIADISHVDKGLEKVGAGSITAALFLREFAGGVPWAHLDVSGPGRRDKEEHELNKGSTGFGARLLLTWLGSEALASGGL
jgi:leucyl aminopeptidase